MHAGLNRLILDTDASVLLVTGVGHGAPANLANQWVDGSLAEVYPEMGRNRDGLACLVRSFSWPGGLPSHLSPLHPGVIHEGGELGYALAKSFGAAFDNPDLLVACIVGDGEFETGLTATAWHSTKFLNPATDGAVLPLLHRNGYKISNPTVPGTMSDPELRALMEGYGWRPWFVDGDDLDVALADVLDAAYAEIRTIQADARAGRPASRPRWPMVIVTSPKGWTGIKELDGLPIEGTWRARTRCRPPTAAPIPTTWRQSKSGCAPIESRSWWIWSARPATDVLALCPIGQRRMGSNPHALGGAIRVPLRLPAVEDTAVPVNARGVDHASALETVGAYLASVVEDNATARNFRIVSPDELESNKLGAVLDVTTRAYEWPLRPVDIGHGRDGRVLEMLSEHNCQGWLEGYILTGRHGLFPSYEAFVEIVTGMTNQLAKFFKVARELPWRPPVSSFNYLLTSEGWRQEHNGYSHQGPGFINAMLNKKASVSRIYLPPDANTLLTVMERCLSSTNSINLIVASKQPLPQWLTIDEARAHCEAGASMWEWAGSAGSEEPEIVFACAGAIPTVETLAAVQLLRQDLPNLATRVVNVVDLLALQNPEDHPHGLSAEEFCRLFTEHRPVVFFFHGYPTAVHELVHHRPDPARFHVGGYVEEGTTEPPFQLLIDNGVSRYDLAIRALQRASGHASISGRLIEEYTRRIHLASAYIRASATDPPEIMEWTWASGPR